MQGLLKGVRTVRRMGRGDRLLILRSWLVLNAVRLGLWLLPFRVVRHLLTILSPSPDVGARTGSPSINRIIRAVTLSSHFSPGSAKCLARALTTQCLLHRAGYATELHIGVLKNDRGQLEAHAWLEYEGIVVMGRLDTLSRYTPLPIPCPVRVERKR